MRISHDLLRHSVRNGEKPRPSPLITVGDDTVMIMLVMMTIATVVIPTGGGHCRCSVFVTVEG